MRSGALSGVRVVERTGWNGVLAGRLLAEAGADVVRVVPRSGDLLESEAPFFEATGVSIQSTWYNANKRVLALDEAAEPGTLARLLSAADIFLDDSGDALPPGAGHRGLVRVKLSPFGNDGPWSGYRTNDLVANALSGAASVTGDPTTPPLTGYGNQSYHTVGLYAAICALAGLRFMRATGSGLAIDLSAHEALASCTEQVLMQWFFPGAGNWGTTTAERIGSLHWSRAYEVYAGRTGRGIMVTASLRPVEVLLPWLAESGSAEDLDDLEKYPNIVALIRDLPHVMEVLKRWVAKNDADELFFEAQRRRQPFGVVLDIASAADTPQIKGRRYVQAVDVPGAGTRVVPGRLFRTDADVGHIVAPRRAAADEIDWKPRPDTPLASSGTPTQPLAGIRILDFTHVLAGPFGTRVLADLGADVIKVGSTARGGGANSAAHPYYVMWNRNKRSISLNMATESGREIARQLAIKSDVVIDNFSAGVLKRWGLDHAALSQGNPRITCISMAGMGNDGPWQDFVTFAPTIHAVTGLTFLTGVPGRHDIGYGFSLTDHLSGLAAAVAALEGVEQAARTGKGLAVDLAQYEVGLGLMAPALMDYLANGTNPEPCGNRHPFEGWAPHGIYPCRGEEAWIAIACRGDPDWDGCRRVLKVADDARFGSHEERLRHQDTLDATIATATMRWERYELMARLQEAGVAAGVVQNAADLTGADPQLALRNYFGTAQTPVFGEYGIDRFPARFNGERPALYEGTAEMGVHTFTVLNEILGLGDEQVAQLMSEGALA